MTLKESATVENPSGPNLRITYLDSILLRDPLGEFMTGLDADASGPYLNYSRVPGYPEFPEVPSTNFTGDGYGGSGKGGFRMSLDSESLVLGDNGSFWIGDEYGPYIYQFSAEGHLLQAIRPPDAYIPVRNNSVSFSADSPPIYDPDLEVIPSDNPTGRDDNQVRTISSVC